MLQSQVIEGFWLSTEEATWNMDEIAEFFGLKDGVSGPHTSRTMMSDELGMLLAHFNEPDSAQSLTDYEHAIVDDNILTKPTQATRKASLRFLRELYSLDQSVPLFRALRKLWKLDESSHPLIAMLSAYGRDPTLRAAAPVILSTPVDSEVSRTQLSRAIKEFCDETMADSTIDKIVRNAGSSFTQSGHLYGRVRKVRILVKPTPTAITFALLLAYAAGTRGKRLLSSEFVRLIDADEDTARARAIEARKLGLIELRENSNAFDIGFAPLIGERDWRRLNE